MAQELEIQDIEKEEEQVPPSGDPAEEYFKYLKKAGADTPPSLDSFKKTLQNPESAQQYYKYLKDNKFDTPPTFESFSKTLNISSLPSFDYRSPIKQTVAKESTNIKIQPTIQLPTQTTKNQLLTKYNSAKDVLHAELTQNNDIIPGLIKKQKEQSGQQYRLSQLGLAPQSDQPLTAVQQTEKRLQPDMPEAIQVSDEEVQDYATLAQKDISAGRAFLQHVAQQKPERAKQIQQATYLHDAMQRLGDDPNAEQKMGKILLNAKKIDKGDLHYSVQSGMLTKPEDAWESISTGLKEKNKAFSDYDVFRNATPQQAIQELEKRRSDHDPDEPISVPQGMLAGFAEGMAGQPIKGLLAGKIAGAGTAIIPGGGEFAPTIDKFVSAAVSSNDFRKMSYARALQNTYNKLRNEGMSPEDAYQKANGEAKDESMVDALAGGAMMYGAGMIGELKLPKFNLSQGFTSAIKNGLKQGAKGIGEAGAVGLIQGEAEQVKNDLADMKGIDRRGDIGEAIKSGTLFTLGMALLAKGASSLSGKTKSEILQGLTKATPEQIDAELGNQLLEQHITPEEAVNVKKLIDEHKDLDKSIPDNVTDESRLKIQQAIKRRRLLEIQLESEDAAFHPETKEKIKKINEDIVELSKDKTAKGEEDENKIGEPEPVSEEPTEGVDVPETENSIPSISSGDVIISQHLDGPQSVRSVSEDGKTVFVESLADHHVHEIPMEEVTLKVKNTAQNEPQQAPEPTETPVIEQPKEAEAPKSIDGETPAQPETKQQIETPTSEDPGMTGISHARTDEAARQFGLDTYETKPETVAQWDEEADKRLKEDPQAIPKLLNKLKNDEQPDKIEQRMMMRYLASLKARIEENATPELIAKYKEGKTLSDIMGGREVGKSLAARRGSTPTVDSLADYLTEDMESAKVDELTPEQIKKNTEEYDAIKQKQAEYEKKIADLEEENTKLRAESEIKKTGGGKRGTKKTRDDYVKERKSIIEEMRADLLKAAKGEGGLTSSVPGAAQLKAIAPHIAKLVKSLVEEGVDKLEDIVKNIHGDIKDIVEGISEKDIHNIIAGEYAEKRQTKGDLDNKLTKLKQEAALINRLERLQKGEGIDSEKKKSKPSSEIAVIKKEIAKIQKETTGEAIDPKGVDLTRLEKIKSRNEKETSAVQEKIKKGDFGPDEKKGPWYEDEELRKKYPKQFEEAIKATDDFISAKKERAFRLAKQEYENRTGRQRFWDSVKQILGLRRAINTAFDFSVPFRQASRVTMNPLQIKTTGKAFKTMFSHTFSPKAFDRWFFNLEKSPDYLNMQKDGLYISSPDELRLSKREEQFQTDLAGKIPILREPFNASQRAASAYLNQMRVDLYRSGSKLLTDKGIKREETPKAYESLAKLANNLTGRGNLMEWLEGKPASELSQIFYGPRLMASKFNLLNPLFYAKMPKPIRREALANMAGYLSFYTTVGVLANVAGASVSLDPNDPDFLKIKRGDTKYDITGGEAVYVRTFLRVLGAAYDRINGTPEEQTKSVNKASSSVLSFFRNKLAPNTSYALNAFLGKNSVGEPFDPKEALKYYPMWIDDMVDDWKQDGAASILTAAIPSVFGLGVQTYVPKESSGGSGGGSGAGGSFKIIKWK